MDKQQAINWILGHSVFVFNHSNIPIYNVTLDIIRRKSTSYDYNPNLIQASFNFSWDKYSVIISIRGSYDYTKACYLGFFITDKDLKDRGYFYYNRYAIPFMDWLKNTDKARLERHFELISNTNQMKKFKLWGPYG